MYLSLLCHIAQEAMHVLLPKMLRHMPMCSSRRLWQQTSLPLLQQLEDPRRTTQMPLKKKILIINKKPAIDSIFM